MIGFFWSAKINVWYIKLGWLGNAVYTDDVDQESRSVRHLEGSHVLRIWFAGSIQHQRLMENIVM